MVAFHVYNRERVVLHNKQLEKANVLVKFVHAAVIILRRGKVYEGRTIE